MRMVRKKLHGQVQLTDRRRLTDAFGPHNNFLSPDTSDTSVMINLQLLKVHLKPNQSELLLLLEYVVKHVSLPYIRWNFADFISFQ